MLLVSSRIKGGYKNVEKIFVDGIETFYSVSDNGEIRNDLRNKILKLSSEQDYKTIVLHIIKNQKNFAFIV